MRKLLTLAAGSLLTITTAIGQAPAKRRVAVLDFNYGTVKTSVQALFGTDQDIGKGITDLLIDKLVNDGTYRVIERQAMSKIVAEQNFSNSNRADPSSAAQIGKLLGVDTIIIGDITQFGRDDHNTNLGGAGGTLGKYGIGGLGLHKGQATVAVTARLVDVNTGEILASITGTGSSKRSGTNLLGGGSNGWTGGGGHVDMGSANFGQTIIGEAVHSAVNQVGAGLDAKAAGLPVNVAPKTAVDGLIADVSGNQLVLNVGASNGVQVGDTLNVSHVGRVIRDPSSGKVLRSMDSQIGTVTITSVDSGSAVGNFSGTGAKVGDKVKSK